METTLYILALAILIPMLTFQAAAVIAGVCQIVIGGVRSLRRVRFSMGALLWLTLATAILLATWRLVPEAFIAAFLLLGTALFLLGLIGLIIAYCMGMLLLMDLFHAIWISWLKLAARVRAAWLNQSADLTGVEPPG